MDRSALARRLKERGAEIGFAAVGIAPVAPSDRAAFLDRWLASGYAGSMEWMRRTRRDSVDLTRRFSWARSAVVAAASYLPYRGSRDSQPGLTSNMARHALGRDYHATMSERLGALAAFLESQAPGTRTRLYVDTGPSLEREMAARAGTGWFGKNARLRGAGHRGLGARASGRGEAAPFPAERPRSRAGWSGARRDRGGARRSGRGMISGARSGARLTRDSRPCYKPVSLQIVVRADRARRLGSARSGRSAAW